ncbi:MAG TPA: class I SAM-dependent methyltransferase [Caulifigura sp.]|jgi:SAM-dependent methyltransferase|nr:class I SAM-dependent methyltransferase [Caulifigura sp.]
MAETGWVRSLANVPRLFDALRWILEGGYRGHHRVVRTLAAAPGRVLDLGCGTGIYSPFFSPDGYLGVDISPDYIAAARAKYPAHQFEVCDATGVNLPGASFDACMISGVLHHLDDDTAGRVIQEAARLVRPGGSVVIWEDVPAPWWNAVGHLIHRLDLGNFIRSPEGYANLLAPHLKITDSNHMRSGAMDYHVFHTTTPRE